MKRRKFLKDIGLTTTAVSLAGCGSAHVSSDKNLILPDGTMPMNRLGSTGIDVSALGFGAHLRPWLVKQPKLRDRIIKLGYEGGINLFDVYDREEYQQYKPMSTSIRNFRQNIILSLYAIKGTKHLQDDIDFALRTFKTDYIDLYRFRPLNDKSLGIMEKNRQAGKIRAIGAAAHSAETLIKYVDRYGASLDYLFAIYNFHHNRFVIKYDTGDNEALIDRCQRGNIGLIGMKPMGSDAMIDLAHKRGYFKDGPVNIGQAALRHVYQRPEFASAVTAMNSIDEVLKNLGAAYNPVLSGEERAMLDSLSSEAAAEQGAYLPRHYRWLEHWAC